MLFSIIIFVFAITHAQAKELRVLFIGNSYTYYHDVPNIVTGLAQASGNV